MIDKIKNEPQNLFNFLISIIVVIFGSLTAIIGWNVSQFDDRLNQKAEKEVVAELCTRMDTKADKELLNRIDSGIQLQLKNLNDEVRGARADIKMYYLRGIDK